MCVIEFSFNRRKYQEVVVYSYVKLLILVNWININVAKCIKQ